MLRRFNKIGGLLIMVLVGGVGLLACETSEENKLGAAQACLDSATPATAQDCISQISGISGERAARLYCGALFVQGGLTTTRFKSAYQELKNSSTGSSTATAGMMTYLVLDRTRNSSITSQIRSVCYQTGLSSFMRIADLAYMATTFTDLASLTNPTPAQLIAALPTLSTASDSEIGAITKNLASTSCNASQGTPPDYCNVVNSSAAAGLTDAQVGECLRKKLANATLPSYCPAN